VEPLYTAMTPSHVVSCSNDHVYLWHYADANAAKAAYMTPSVAAAKGMPMCYQISMSLVRVCVWVSCCLLFGLGLLSLHILGAF